MVLVGLGASIVNIILEVSLSDEPFNLVFEGDAFFCGVADISVKPAVFIFVPLLAVSPHLIGSFIHSCVLRGQEHILT